MQHSISRLLSARNSSLIFERSGNKGQTHLLSPSCKAGSSFENTSLNQPASLECSSPGCRKIPASRSFCARMNSRSRSERSSLGRKGDKSTYIKKPALLSPKIRYHLMNVSYMRKNLPSFRVLDTRTLECRGNQQIAR